MPVHACNEFVKTIFTGEHDTRKKEREIVGAKKEEEQETDELLISFASFLTEHRCPSVLSCSAAYFHRRYRRFTFAPLSSFDTMSLFFSSSAYQVVVVSDHFLVHFLSSLFDAKTERNRCMVTDDDDDEDGE